MPITAIVLTYNSALSIERCLKSLTFCDEIIVIDDGSTDETKEIAKKHAKVQEHPLAGDYAAQRNWAMQQSTNNWVLFIDSDEVVSDQLRLELTKLSNHFPDSVSGFRIGRRDFFFERELKYGETARVRNYGLTRLVRKENGVWEGAVHEDWIPTSGNISKVAGYIDHFPHQTIREFLLDVNEYSTLRARELQKKGKKATTFELIIYPLGKFISTFFWQRGFMDGAEGFIYSFMMSFHSFLVRAKLIQYTFYDPAH